MKPKTNSLTLAPDPRVTALKSRATKFLKLCQDTEVTDTPSCELAGATVKDAVAIRRDLKSLLGPEIEKAKAAFKAKEKVFKDIDNILKSAEGTIRDALAAYAARQREAREKLIEKAMDKGQDEKAAALAAKPFVPDMAGVSFTERWHAEVTDKLAFIKAVANGDISPDALEPNLVWLNVIARAEEQTMHIPGVKAVKETFSTVRA